MPTCRSHRVLCAQYVTGGAGHADAVRLPRSLFEVADGLTGQQLLDAGCAAIGLLVMALRDVASVVPGGEGSAEVLSDMIRVHIHERLVEPDPGVEEVARRHRVSVNRLYTLFGRIGTTPGVYVREQRLLVARAMLSDPRYARSGRSRIAAAVGSASSPRSNGRSGGSTGRRRPGGGVSSFAPCRSDDPC